MITTKITVEPHLAQYCYAKYSSDPEGSMPVRFADHLDVYHLVYNRYERKENGFCVNPERRIYRINSPKDR